MGAIISTLQMGMAYCCCNTAASICNTCVGSTGVNATGRKRSVILLSFVILFSLLFQYSLAPSILKENKWWKIYSSIPGMGKYLKTAFLDGCEMYEDQNQNENDGIGNLYLQCVSNAAVYRPTLVSTIFFICTAIAAKMSPSLNREIWPAKYSSYLIALIITLFIPNTPLFTPFYLLFMRICAMIFIVIQQVILIDMAYNWNESWVERSNICESREWGSGKKWLHAIVASAITLYLGSLIGVTFLYKYFSGEAGSDVSCGGNITIITLTWIGIVLMSVAQLSGMEGSLLTTAVISAYSTYLAYSTVSKNPNATCNPTLGNEDVWGIAIGLFFTMISLIWTGWSWTASERLTEQGVEAARSLTPVNPERPDAATLNLDVPFLDDDERPTTGLVVSSNDEERFNNRHKDSLWKLNVVLVLISCWVAASLTGWGTITGGIGEGGENTAANPLVGRFNMAMIALSQNLAVCLYMWTLLAPRIFPDRDFS